MSSGGEGGKLGGMDEFLAEASEIVERLQEGVTRLDEGLRTGSVSPTQLNEVFRTAHSLKGLAGIFGVETVVVLAHAFEELLHEMRLGRVPLDPEILVLLYEVGETFGAVLRTLQSGATQDPAPLKALADRLQQAARGQAGSAEHAIETLDLPEEMLSVLTEYEEHRLAENARAGVPLFIVRGVYSLETFDRDLGALSSFLGGHGELLTTLPGSDAPAGYIAFKILFSSRSAPAEWQGALEELPGEVDARPVGTRDPAEHQHSPAPVAEADAAPMADAESAATGFIGDSVRVDIRKLDQLMNVVGELALVRGEVTSTLERLQDLDGAQRLSLDLLKTSRAFERHLLELQQGIMNVRMVPLRLVFDRLSRTVRRLSREMGKEVRFEVSGEDTELDKVIIEQLSDPLNHLVRNCLDHGLEAAELRATSHKSPVGTISIGAYPKGRHVVIEVRDDGAGLDEVAIRRTALERGLVEEERVGGMSRKELWNFIFQPGFSTRRDATELSGRGVGMDVVKTNISRMSGMIEVSSDPRHGTSFVITLPITLAIVQALIVVAGDRVFALPLSSVLEIRTLEESAVRTIEGRAVMLVRNGTIPLLWLTDAFGLERREMAPGQRYVVVVGLAQNRLGIVTDDLQGQQDIIIKPLGKLLRRVPGIAGATDLGSGHLELVLDVGELVGEAFVAPQAVAG